MYFSIKLDEIEINFLLFLFLVLLSLSLLLLCLSCSFAIVVHLSSFKILHGIRANGFNISNRDYSIHTDSSCPYCVYSFNLHTITTAITLKHVQSHVNQAWLQQLHSMEASTTHHTWSLFLSWTYWWHSTKAITFCAWCIRKHNFNC